MVSILPSLSSVCSTMVKTKVQIELTSSDMDSPKRRGVELGFLKLLLLNCGL